MRTKKLLTLAVELREHERELRADLQQYYGIDLDHAMSGEHSATHIACLLIELPIDARVRVAEVSDAAWTREQVLIAALLNSLNGLIYGMSDPRKRGKRPEIVGPSWMKKGSTRSLPARAMPINELMEILSRPRG